MKSGKTVIYNVVTQVDNAISGLQLGELLTDSQLWKIKKGYFYQHGKKTLRTRRVKVYASTVYKTSWGRRYGEIAEYLSDEEK